MKNTKYLKFVKITKNSGMGFVKYMEIMEIPLKNFLQHLFLKDYLDQN